MFYFQGHLVILLSKERTIIHSSKNALNSKDDSIVFILIIKFPCQLNIN